MDVIRELQEELRMGSEKKRNGGMEGREEEMGRKK